MDVNTISALLWNLKMKCLGLKAILDTDGAKYWAEVGEESGLCPPRRCMVQILGDARAGKTSLRKTLMGEEFNPDEKTTNGIESKMCQVSTVDQKWQEKKIDGKAEYEEALCWYIVRQTINNFKDVARSIKYQLKDLTSAFVLFLAFIALLVFWSSHISGGICYIRGIPHISDLKNLFIVKVFFTNLFLGFLFGDNIGSTVAVYSLALPNALHILLEDNPTITLSTTTLIYLVVGIGMFGLTCGFGMPCVLYGAFVGFLLTKQSEGDHLCWLVEYVDEQEVTLVSLSLGFTVALTLRAILSAVVNFRFRPCRELTFYLLVSCAICGFITISDELSVFMFGIVLGLVTFVTFNIGCMLSINTPSAWQAESFVDHILMHLIILIMYAVKCLSAGGMHDIWGFVYLNVMPWITCFIFSKFSWNGNPVLGTVTLNNLREKLFFLAKSGSIWPNLQMWLGIADFAGQEIYYNTHHTFMTPNALFVLTFDITRFVKPIFRDKQYNKILFWLRSIRTHTESPILLVATHTDETNSRCLGEIQEYFSSKSKINDPLWKRIVWNDDKPFFAVDNSLRKSRDIAKLKMSIWRTACKTLADREHHPLHPIRWLNFLSFIDKLRMNICTGGSLSNMIMTIQEVQKSFGSTDCDDFTEMLEHFHEIGEILFESDDPFLSQYIVLDKHFIVRAAESIHSVPERSRQGRLMPYWNLLSERGVLHFTLAKHLFNEDSKDEFTRIVLSILESKGLICKIYGSELPEDEYDIQDNYDYIVPSMLPHGDPEVPPVEDVHQYFFDFGDFMPDALFTRLLARCQSQSNLQCEVDEQRYLYREAGEFNLESSTGRFCYWLRLHAEHPAQSLIKVSVKAYCGSNPFDLLRHIWQLIEDLREQQFPQIRFHCGPECPHSHPHEGPKDKPLHILNEAHENQPSFSEPNKHFTCRHREIPLDRFRQYNPRPESPPVVDDESSLQGSSATPCVNGNKNFMINNPGVVNINEGWIAGNQGSVTNFASNNTSQYTDCMEEQKQNHQSLPSASSQELRRRITTASSREK